MQVSLKNYRFLVLDAPLSEIVTWAAVIMLFGFTWWLQGQIYIHGDPSWGMQAALRMLQGGNYWQDFFDVDAPMTFYIYLLPAWIAASCKLSPIVVVRGYSFILAAISWWLCRGLLKRALGGQARMIAAVLQITIAYIFLILPANQFAQREHLLLFFTFPYFLLAYIRTLEQNVSLGYAIGLGLLAGIGFAIKPFFLVSLILVELYLAVYKKTCKVWLRPEILTIAWIMLVYLASVFILFPEYLFTVIPLVIHIYYPSASVSYGILILSPFTLLLAVITLLLIALHKQLIWPALAEISLLATWGFWLSFVLQQTIWYYHAVPYLAFTFFTLILILCNYFPGGLCVFRSSEKANNYARYFVWLSSLIIILYFVLMTMQAMRNAIALKRAPVNVQIISKMQQLAKGRSFYYFSTDSAYPLADYANIHSASRFAALWMSGVLFGQSATVQPPIVDLTAERTFLRNAIIDDLSRGKPTLILVSLHKPTLYQNNFTINQLEFIKILLQDERFQRIWRNYYYVTSINGIEYYALKNVPDY